MGASTPIWIGDADAFALLLPAELLPGLLLELLHAAAAVTVITQTAARTAAF
jgi:hypothetical protein